MMKYYKVQHRYYCGIDLHANKMYVCIVDSLGKILVHQNIDAKPNKFLSLVDPYRDGLVVGVECMYCWYWLADLCRAESIPFVLGHALYMKAIAQAKSGNDKLDSERIAMLLKSGMFPQAFVYPHEMRATRDLMRRRCFFVRKRAELSAHISMTFQQYNMTRPKGELKHKYTQAGIVEAFDDPSVRHLIQGEINMINHYTTEIGRLDTHIKQVTKREHLNQQLYLLLRTIPGIGEVLALTILYEIQSISRFETVQKFCSYARLVKSKHSSNGKAKAFSLLAHKIGRAVYFMLLRQQPFSEEKFMKV
jgi:transposase